MEAVDKKNKEILVKFNTDELTPHQIRLIKNVHSLLAAVLTSEEEGEYFDASADLMKKAAELIKCSNFGIKNKTMAYGLQAVEFAVDSLSESLENNTTENIDN